VRIFGVDPGSQRTGFGCIETNGSRYKIVISGVLEPPPDIPFSQKLLFIHEGLSDLLTKYRPDVMAIENLFFARNARSALILGHVRGVLILAAAEKKISVSEYSPTEVKRAVVGYGRAEKSQVQQMVMLLLGLEVAPSPLDVSDALGVAICHGNSIGTLGKPEQQSQGSRSWRDYKVKEQSK
tara:strand:+ start:622 stop:1167 length:546 start_codon:yes stop_codon:yes gene_type:complete